jgi:hypothetical protein
MKLWRIGISAFILLLLLVVTLGAIWVAGHQPPGPRTASHVVLGLSGAAGVLALVRLWR